MKSLTRLAISAVSSRRGSTWAATTSEGRQSADDKILPIDRVQVESPLCRLPLELLIEVLTLLPRIASLQSAILSCKALYDAYLAAPDYILSSVTALDIGRSYLDAVAVASCDALLDCKDVDYDTSFFDLLDRYRTTLDLFPLELGRLLGKGFFGEQPPARLLALRTTMSEVYGAGPPYRVDRSLQMRHDQHPKLDLHLAVRSTAEAFCKDVMPCIRSTQANPVLSSHEEHRLIRALYRFEFYCRAVCHHNARAFVLTSEERALLFLSSFTCQEAEEIACVVYYIQRKCRGLLSSVLKEDKYDLRTVFSGLSKEARQEQMASQGLVFFAQALKSKTAKEVRKSSQPPAPIYVHWNRISYVLVNNLWAGKNLNLMERNEALRKHGSQSEEQQSCYSYCRDYPNLSSWTDRLPRAQLLGWGYAIWDLSRFESAISKSGLDDHISGRGKRNRYHH